MSILLKLGLIKLSQDDFLKRIAQTCDLTAESILEKHNVNLKNRNESISEIKIFLWIYSVRHFNKLPKNLIQKIGEYFDEEIIFSTINETKLTEEFKISLVKERINFHRSGMSKKLSENYMNNYYTQLYTLFFTNPFAQIKEIENPLSNLNLENGLKNAFSASEISEVFTNIIPKYDKQINKLIKYVS